LSALEQKTVLITGAAARVGASIATRLHAAGAFVIIHYRSSAAPAEALRDELLATRPDSVALLQADLLDPEQIDRLARQATGVTGGLDILVNNASTYYPTPVGSATLDQWKDLFGTNARAPFFLSQALAPALRASHGCIVNLVDIHAERPRDRHPVYSMAKAANAMMVKTLARELAPEIRVNGVAPGAVLWPEDYFTDQDRMAILERIPLNRPGTPDEIAGAVLYLAQAEYVTGQILAVDGGRTVQQ
jgi:pteridine reductase